MKGTVWFNELVGYSMYGWFSCQWRRIFLSISMSTMPLGPIKPLQNILCIMKWLSLPLTVLRWVGLDCVFWGFVAVMFCFMRWGCKHHTERPTWRNRVPILVGVSAFHLSSMRGPTSSYATASLPVRVIWPHKPHHYIRVVIPLLGSDMASACKWCCPLVLSIIITFSSSSSSFSSPHSPPLFLCSPSSSSSVSSSASPSSSSLFSFSLPHSPSPPLPLPPLLLLPILLLPLLYNSLCDLPFSARSLIIVLPLIFAVCFHDEVCDTMTPSFSIHPHS